MYKAELRAQREYRGFTLVAHDPYGFWSILDDKDVDYTVPSELSGNYTSDFDIDRAIDAYLAKQEKEKFAAADAIKAKALEKKAKEEAKKSEQPAA